MMRRCTSIILNFAVLIIAVLLKSTPYQAIIKGDVELLKTVALQHKSNFESILTLKGEAFEERTSTRGDWYEYMVKYKCTFAYDQLRDAVRWNKGPQEIRRVRHGEPQLDFIGIDSHDNSTMFKDGTYFKYSGFGQPNDKNKVSYNLVIGESKMARGEQGHCLDPRYFLSYPGGITIYSRLMLLYNHANDKNEIGRSVKREGDLVILQYSPDETRTSREVYDLSAKGNMVEYYSKTPTVEITKNYKYEKKSGVWLLKLFVRTTINHRKNGEISKWTRKIDWTNSVVNVPFEEDEFTLEKLGVKRGTKISDHRINKLYRYEGVLAEVPTEPGTLTGRELPQTDGFGIILPPESTNGKIILLCFWNMKQRPARQCVLELANRIDDLKKKGVMSVLIHASPANTNDLKEWMKKFKIPSPCGVITGDDKKVEAIRNKWGVRGLPWLILVDKKHIVRAEGFGINELDERIMELASE